jgi:putative transposase
MNDHIHKSHNSTLLLYHLVCLIKNRHKLLTEEVSKTLKNICLEITLRYELHFLEIGCDAEFSNDGSKKINS